MTGKKPIVGELWGVREGGGNNPNMRKEENAVNDPLFRDDLDICTIMNRNSYAFAQT